MISLETFHGRSHAQTLTAPGVPKLIPQRARFWSLRAGVPGMYVSLPALDSDDAIRLAGTGVFLVLNSGSVEAFDVKTSGGSTIVTVAVGEAYEFFVASAAQHASATVLADLSWVARERTVL